MNSKIIILGMMCIALTSCYNDKEDLLYGNDDCVVQSVSFANDIEPIISNSCAKSGCHVQGGAGNGIFDSYAAIKAKVDNGTFRDRVVVKREMPPDVPLTNCQLAYIEQWLNDGAPNN